ncbi:MAG: carboxypeptidase regulatory-like domain-containing protein, partial [Gemmatimonas sp.]
MAQPRAVPDTPDLPAGYRRLADVREISGPLAKAVTLDVTQVPLKDILRQIASQTGLSYAADPAQPGMDVRRTLKVAAMPAHRAIALLLEGTSLQALVSPTGQLAVAYRGPAGGPGSRTSPSGQRVRLSGYVRSAASGEVLRRARLSADDETVRVESNDDGFYSLLLTTGTHRVVVRALGYAPFDTVVSLTNDITLTVLLQRREVQLATVAVQANRGGDDRPDLDPRTPDM